MRYSKLFGKTQHSPVKPGKFSSHELLLKAGFIQESVAGRYFFLPLGWRVHDKIKAVIKSKMDAAGAQEMITPTLHPLELWQETNRTNTTGFELMKVQDRRGAEFALGGTAEEMFVDVVRGKQITYKDLPFNLYQFSNKFRDELRARGGLLRVREFIMKDAYSFHTDEEDFKLEYQKMAEAYSAIFTELGLKTQMVAADNGYIGGEYCHEFQVEHPEGEGRYFVSADGEYIAHEDVAEFARDEKNLDEPEKDYQEVAAERGKSMEAGAEHHQLPLWQQLKDVLMVDDTTQTTYLALIRGDLDVNETKLLHLVGANQLRMASDEEIRALGSEPGFISPVGLQGKVTIVGDSSLRTVKNFYGGANAKNLDALNMNLDRDFKLDVEGDIGMAKAGHLAPDDHGELQEKSGIEVGNIFQLGYHYSKKMTGATYVAQDGTSKPYYMGCYGIGLGRTMATVVEMHHDERGIVWPDQIAPYKVHLISLSGGEEAAESLYQQLTSQGIEVLWDDRAESAGSKFASADLIGIPIRLVVSAKTGNQVEWKERRSQNIELLDLEQLMSRLS